MDKKHVAYIATVVLGLLVLGAALWMDDAALDDIDAPNKGSVSTLGPSLVSTRPVLSGTSSATVLISRARRSLYVFDKDAKPGVSACYGECEKKWPPFIVGPGNFADPAVPGNFGTIVRADGRVQMTYNGKPLYYYAEDVLPGEMKGDGANGVWHLIKITQ